MHSPPTFSLIVPTRRRPLALRRFLDSVANTATHLEQIEVVLVVDEDDRESFAFVEGRLVCRATVGAPGRTMGALNQAGYAASTGRYLMLLNDDVVVRTRGWDEVLARHLDEYADGIVLGHVNDTLMRDRLCTFPVVSRTFCALAGALCPTDYLRYRIDDHLEDVFNLLAALGHRRTVYFPELVFEHLNAVVMAEGHREYHADPAILALDAPVFERHAAARKRLVLRLLDHIDEAARQQRRVFDNALLEKMTDPFALRIPGRQRVIGRMEPASGRPGVLGRMRACWQRRGWRGIAGAVLRRLRRSVVTPPVPGTPPG